MTYEAQSFAADWQAGWNSHDLDRILSHYSGDVTFCSRKAVPLTGDGVLRGKPALRAYWAEALRRQPDLRFEVQEVFEGFEMLALTYCNQRGVRAVEVLHFNAAGLVYRAAACHAATS